MTRTARVSETSAIKPLTATRSPVVGLGVAVKELLSDPAAKTATPTKIQNERSGFRRAVGACGVWADMGLHPEVLLGGCDAHQDRQRNDSEDEEDSDDHGDRAPTPQALGVAVDEGQGDQDAEEGDLAVQDPR